MKLKYISIDIETTSLDPKHGQILEIAAVYDYDSTVPPDLLPTFNSLVGCSDGIQGDLAAIRMNAGLLSEINENTPSIREVSEKFEKWLISLGIDGSFYAAGKNFASFDGPWLKEHLTFPIKWKHRVLDLGSLYLREDDSDIPNLNECLRRAGLAKSCTHRALDDAMDVVKCIRRRYGIAV